MAKSFKKKSSQAVSIDDIYEMLKGRNFTEDLWLDLLSDIKEKPTYKRMKEMVTSAINNKLQDFEQEPIDKAERTKRRAALTEISIMAYTVDRVISEVLYKRLENEFKTLIVDMLEELQTKKPVEKSNAPVKINSMLENIESLFSDLSEKEEKKVTKSLASPKKVTNQTPTRKRGRPPGSANLSRSSESSKEKDADSDGNLSLDSISSVHTTDLSSFDDSVSVCTDDGINGRKTKLVTLKKANSMIVEGKLSQIYQIGKKSQKIKEALKDPSRKVLPQRKRKPNKKYNSETMYCQVKDYFSDRSDSPTSNPADDIATIQSQINKKAKRMKTNSDDDKKVIPKSPITTRFARNQSSSSDSEASLKAACPTMQKSSTQRYNPSDLYKPRFNFGSTCSTRGTEAFSVFSS